MVEYKSTKVPKEIWKQLKQVALERDITIAKLVEELLNGK